MINKYNSKFSSVYLLNYHFIFCPRYRKNLFDIPFVEIRFKQLIHDVCDYLNIIILALECHHDHVHLFVSVDPNLKSSYIMQRIKGYTSKLLRSEYKQLSHYDSLWSRSYFVSSAGNVSSSTIKHYVDTQKCR